MSVSAIIVTRGDVDLTPILHSLPREWERIVWNNGTGRIKILPPRSNGFEFEHRQGDLSVYGRYAAISHTRSDLIYVQDDDVLHTSESLKSIIDFYFGLTLPDVRKPGPWVVCNMPQRFRHDFYVDHALVGFGALFHRDLPSKAFRRFLPIFWTTRPKGENFLRCCDIVFTALTPRILVDVPYTDLPWADSPGRMWKQALHVAERSQTLELVRKVRDAA